LIYELGVYKAEGDPNGCTIICCRTHLFCEGFLFRDSVWSVTGNIHLIYLKNHLKMITKVLNRENPRKGTVGSWSNQFRWWNAI